ncbi:MAG: aminopeptidase [Bacillota bacterium]
MPNIFLENDQNRCTETIWDKITPEEKRHIFALGEDYRAFLSAAKTERQCVQYLVDLVQQAGFVDLAEKEELKPGDRVYHIHRQKALFLAVIGQQPPAAGLQLIGAHIDAPRLDLKPQPLYEDHLLALAKTHYYGGIKKYQWVAIPLALHGTVVKEDGSVLELSIGEQPGEPVFTISDLLPHLAKDQMEKKMAEGIGGEDLNALLGSLPSENMEVKKRFKEHVKEVLREKYDLSEEDLISAELCLVPAWPARDVGLDRGLVGGYGQDDRVCAYTATRALLEQETPPRTAVLVLADKEETGSEGNTGMFSVLLENFVLRLLAASGTRPDLGAVRQCLSASCALSADVNAALDPNYEQVLDKLNAARLGGGVVLTKYTGVRGKSGTSDASAGYLAALRRLFNRHGIYWQTGELGKVDQGGGGTIAYLLAYYDLEVVDCGVPLLSMHSPFEVASKLDIYMAYKAYRAFWAEEI